jgi:hypothetical protein
MVNRLWRIWTSAQKKAGKERKARFENEQRQRAEQKKKVPARPTTEQAAPVHRRRIDSAMELYRDLDLKLKADRKYLKGLRPRSEYAEFTSMIVNLWIEARELRPRLLTLVGHAGRDEQETFGTLQEIEAELRRINRCRLDAVHKAEMSEWDRSNRRDDRYDDAMWRRLPGSFESGKRR